jgi:malate synthase
VADGHDGTWVAHPALVPLAKGVFDEHMQGPNQLDVPRADVHVCADDLLAVPEGTRTERGLRQNVNVGVLYLEAWLRGNGCVPLYHLMEDAATAEISRTQIWQWIRHGALLDDGRPVTTDLFRQILAEELDEIRASMDDAEFTDGRFSEAADLFDAMSTSTECEEFLTLPAYDHILSGPD